MKTTATPQEILAKTYLNISDIQALLGMTREPAKTLFVRVKNLEKEKLGKGRCLGLWTGAWWPGIDFPRYHQFDQSLHRAFSGSNAGSTGYEIAV